MEHPIPYNGTVFMLNGIAQLDQSIDTNVTAVGTWSDSDNLQITTFPPYITSLEFRPLTSDSSREYILSMTIRPGNNSPFIVASSVQVAYRLTVQCKSISIPLFKVSKYLLLM